MIFAPHILQKKVIPDVLNDEYGRPIVNTEDVWEFVCECRCDDNTTKEFKTDNGQVYRPNYHVICERNSVKAGDFVRVLHNGDIRGEGKVYTVKNTNFFDYTEIWM